MDKTKGILTAASTLAIALGIGFVMQSSDEARAWYGSGSTPATKQADPVKTELLDVQSIELTAAAETLETAYTAPQGDEAILLASVPRPNLVEPERDDVLPADPACSVEAMARALPGAVVSLELTAPCLPDEKLTVHHGGMMFTDVTNDAGDLNIMIPALSEDAVFIMAFSNGDGAVATASVKDIDQFDRKVLQWRGSGAFSLHAREFGADYDSDGHVWQGGAQDLTGIAKGERGFVLQLGDATRGEPLMAEVYTFPTGRAAQGGTVYMTVEAEVTAENCGAEIEAQTLERQIGGAIQSRDVILSVPECSAVGDFMVLNNLLSDLTIAAVE